MHPILARRGRLALYLAVWIAFGGLLAGAVTLGGAVPVRFALSFALPVAVLLGFQSLACWYLVRTLPAAETPWLRLVATWLGASIVSLAVWVALALGWARLLLAQQPAEVVSRARTWMAARRPATTGLDVTATLDVTLARARMTITVGGSESHVSVLAAAARRRAEQVGATFGSPSANSFEAVFRR